LIVGGDKSGVLKSDGAAQGCIEYSRGSDECSCAKLYIDTGLGEVDWLRVSDDGDSGVVGADGDTKDIEWDQGDQQPSAFDEETNLKAG
jgi:hypothetical protein